MARRCHLEFRRARGLDHQQSTGIHHRRSLRAMALGPSVFALSRLYPGFGQFRRQPQDAPCQRKAEE